MPVAQTKPFRHPAPARFKREYAALCSQVVAPDEITRREQAAIAFARLLFVSLLQQHDLLPDARTLHDRLARCQQTGNNFYTSVVLPLCAHAAPRSATAAASIPNTACERLLACFAQHTWHLSEQAPAPAATPAVLDIVGAAATNQKQTGTYYTQTDITSYISQHTLIPCLCDAIASVVGPERWDRQLRQVVQAAPDRYIHAAVRWGTKHPLPANIAAGINDVTQRAEWDAAAPEQYALPTETWREVVARRQHCAEVRTRLVAGGGTNGPTPLQINDTITANLAMERLLCDAIATCEDAPLLHAVYQALEGITVLDPTCGTGAFLLAALEVLAPLYAACLGQMEACITASDGVPTALRATFCAILERFHSPFGQQFAICQAIISRNLYGVDLAETAVAISQTRLLLRLCACVAPGTSLPAGGITTNLRVGDALDHHAFDWQCAFPAIVAWGGFDAIIGNPPYVEYRAADASLIGYRTAPCGNMAALVLERSLDVAHRHGRIGMIVPHAVVCTDRMAPLQALWADRVQTGWISTYAIRPAKLFAGIDQRLAICLLECGVSDEPVRYTSRYHRWHEALRPHLLALVQYQREVKLGVPHSIAKIYHATERTLAAKLREFAPLGENLVAQPNAHSLYYHNAPRYWIRAMTFAPYFWNERDGAQLSAQVKTLHLASPLEAAVVAAALNSSLFYWWFIVLSDCRHLNRREIVHFPLGLRQMPHPLQQQLADLCAALMIDLRRHARRRTCVYQTTGRVVYDEFYPRHSAPLLDQIDHTLAQHFGFTDEERDFVLTYDRKYRMGTGET